MATTMGVQTPTRGNARASARVRGNVRERDREEQYDLLTAALIGILVGAGATLLLRRGPSGRRPIGPMVALAGRGARLAGGAALDGARWVRDVTPSRKVMAKKGRAALESLHLDDFGEQLADTFADAREAIADTVESELHDLRKSIRRQRKRLGI